MFYLNQELLDKRIRKQDNKFDETIQPVWFERCTSANTNKAEFEV